MKGSIRTPYYLLLALICVSAYWQVAFNLHPVKYDMPDCYYPWRSFIADALQNGNAPVWNPYQLFGSPIHADPSSGAWYPPVWVIGLLFGYSLKILGWELLLHVWLAGVGFLKLGKRLGFSAQTSFLLSIGYMLSGIFTGNAQHITYVISACWIPFILYYFLNTAQRFCPAESLKGGIALFFLITGGYPAFSIILVYLLLIISLYHFIHLISQKKHREITQWISSQALFGGTALLLSGGFLWSVYRVTPLITRTRSFSAADAQYGPFSPEAILSFILPYTSVDPVFVKTDISMANGYFGMAFFLFFILSFLYKASTLIRIFQAFAIFALSASVGSALPVREWLFDYAPLMNLFRFPGVFRLFVILGCLLSAGIFLEKLVNGEQAIRRITVRTFLVFLVVLPVVGFILTQPYTELMSHKWFTRSEVPDAAFHGGLQAFIMAGFCLLYTLFLIGIKNNKKLFLGLAILIAAEMVLSTQLNAPYTVFYKEFRGQDVKKTEQLFTSGFPLPDLKKPMNSYAAELVHEPFWKNLDIFKKEPSAGGMNNFMFASAMYLLDNQKEALRLLTEKPLAYLGGEVQNPKKFDSLKRAGKLDADLLFMANEPSKKYSSEGQLSVVKFTPENMVFQADAKENTTLTLLQNFSPYWQVELDGKKVGYSCSNGSFITIFLPKGKSEIRFSYQSAEVRLLYLICLVLFITILLVVLKPKIDPFIKQFSTPKK